MVVFYNRIPVVVWLCPVAVSKVGVLLCPVTGSQAWCVLYQDSSRDVWSCHVVESQLCCVVVSCARMLIMLCGCVL